VPNTDDENNFLSSTMNPSGTAHTWGGFDHWKNKWEDGSSSTMSSSWRTLDSVDDAADRFFFEPVIFMRANGDWSFEGKSYNYAYVCEKPRSAISRMCPSFHSGDGNGILEKFLGSVSTHAKCLQMVTTQEPAANGVTFEKGGSGRCYAEFEQSLQSVNPNSEWETCLIAETVVHKCYVCDDEGCFDSLDPMAWHIPLVSSNCGEGTDACFSASFLMDKNNFPTVRRRRRCSTRLACSELYKTTQSDDEFNATCCFSDNCNDSMPGLERWYQGQWIRKDQVQRWQPGDTRTDPLQQIR